MVQRQTTIRLKRAVRHMRPMHVVKKRLTRRVIETFADKVGLVYFGYVDQRDDDHRLIRGHTVSPTHQDDHYCIGTVRGYDVMLALRNDEIRTQTGSDERHHWLIYTIDLHTKADVPHFYIGHRSRDEAFAASYRQLHALAIGGIGSYPYAFANDYTIYGLATNALRIEELVSPQIADVIQSHFHSASIEVEDGVVYVYAEAETPTEAQLETMLSNALWFAGCIDAAYTQTEQQ